MKLNKIIECLENWAPPSLQEEYDNSGLIIGIKQNEIKGILVTLDCTEEVIDEAKGILDVKKVIASIFLVKDLRIQKD